MTMSEKEVQNRAHNLYVRKHENNFRNRNPLPNNRYISKYKSKELKPVSPDPDVTIQIKNSTCEKLKLICFLEGKDNPTYDQLIGRLLDRIN